MASCWNRSPIRHSPQTAVVGPAYLGQSHNSIDRQSTIQLGADHIRQWKAHLLHQKKLAVGTVVNHVAALRFFSARTETANARRSYTVPEVHTPTPRVLSRMFRLIEAAGNLQARTILMVVNSTGVRRSELVHLRVEDIDSRRTSLDLRSRAAVE